MGSFTERGTERTRREVEHVLSFVYGFPPRPDVRDAARLMKVFLIANFAEIFFLAGR